MQELAILAMGIFFIFYAPYCMLKGGTYYNRNGWVSREESPLAFFLLISVYVVLGLISIITFVFLNFS